MTTARDEDQEIIDRLVDAHEAEDLPDRTTAIRVLGLRIAADLLEHPVPERDRQEFPLRQIVFYTGDDQDTLGLDLFDDPTLDAVTAIVRDSIELVSNS